MMAVMRSGWRTASRKHRRAVVKDLHCEPIESDDIGEAVDHAGNIVEGVTEVFSRRHIGLTEPGKVRRAGMKSVGEERDQITAQCGLRSGSRATVGASVRRPVPPHDRK